MIATTNNGHTHTPIVHSRDEQKIYVVSGENSILCIHCASGKCNTVFSIDSDDSDDDDDVSERILCMGEMLVDGGKWFLVVLTDKRLFIDGNEVKLVNVVENEISQMSIHPEQALLALYSASRGQIFMYSMMKEELSSVMMMSDDDQDDQDQGTTTTMMTSVLKLVSQQRLLEEDEALSFGTQVYLDDNDGIWLQMGDAAFRFYRHLDGVLSSMVTFAEFVIKGDESSIIYRECIDGLFVVVSSLESGDFSLNDIFMFDTRRNEQFRDEILLEKSKFNHFAVMNISRQAIGIDLNIVGLKQSTLKSKRDREVIVYTYESQTSTDMTKSADGNVSLELYPRLDFLLEHHLTSVICSSIIENRKTSPSLSTIRLNEKEMYQWLCLRIGQVCDEAKKLYSPYIDPNHPRATRMPEATERTECCNQLNSCIAKLRDLRQILDALKPENDDELQKSLGVTRPKIGNMENMVQMLEVISFWTSEGVLPLTRLSNVSSIIPQITNSYPTHETIIHKIWKELMNEDEIDRSSAFSFGAPLCKQLEGKTTMKDIVEFVLRQDRDPTLFPSLHHIFFYSMTQPKFTRVSPKILQSYVYRFDLSEELQKFLLAASLFDRGQIEDSFQWLMQSRSEEIKSSKVFDNNFFIGLVVWYIQNGYFNFALDALRSFVKKESEDEKLAILTFVANLGLFPNTIHSTFFDIRDTKHELKSKFLIQMFKYCKEMKLLVEFYALPFSQEEIDSLVKSRDFSNTDAYMMYILRGNMQEAVKLAYEHPDLDKLSVASLIPNVWPTLGCTSAAPSPKNGK